MANNPIRAWYHVGRVFSFAVGCLYFHNRVFGVKRVPRHGGLLLAGNHQSVLDPMLQTYALPRECHYVARDTLFLNPFFARLIRSFNAFPIKRDSADLTAVKETLGRLKGGAAILIFPEATRTLDGRIRPLQPGIFSIARKAGVPIVPVVLDGAFEAWPRSAPLPRPGIVWVEYGHPLLQAWIAQTDPRDAAAEVTGQMRAMQNALRQRMGRPPIDYAPQSEPGTPVPG